MPNPTTPKSLPAHVVAARKQAAERVLREEIAADRNAKVFQKLVSDDRHPADEAAAAAAVEAHSKAKAKTSAAATSAGVARKDLEASINENRKDELTMLVLQWKQARDIHQDIADNIEGYGHADLSGTATDQETQLRMVAELDAAIAVAEAEKDSLK